MRGSLVCCLALLANGCAAYTADDNNAFVKLFGDALVNGANGASARPVAPHPGDAAADVLRPDDQTQIGPNTFNCPAGGNMTQTGNFTVEVNPQTATGYSDVDLIMTITMCMDNPNGTLFTINGANELALNGHATVTGGYTSGWTFIFSGGYDVYADGNQLQHCSIQASLTNQGWSGMWCGYALR